MEGGRGATDTQGGCEPRPFRTFACAPPTCPLLLVAFALELQPLFHSPPGHSEYCWEPSWEPNWEPSWACGPDWITVSSELMVSSVEAIPERGGVFLLTDRKPIGVRWLREEEESYFLRAQKHKRVLVDSIRSA